MKNNKKGFTLAEILAVIALIGIIMLLVVPNVLNLFKKGTKASFKNEVMTIYNSVYPTYLAKVSEGEEVTRFCIGNVGTLDKLNISDKNDLYYDISVDSDGNITSFKVVNKDYVYESDNVTKKNIKVSNVKENNGKNKINCVFEENDDLVNILLEDNPTVKEMTTFVSADATNTTGILFKTDNTDYGTDVYYYSGNTSNNWVYFGDYYWRIIRTNEDGSIRLLYVGSKTTDTSYTIGYSKFNETDSGVVNVGYMYGSNDSVENSRLNTSSSSIKKVLDNWFADNLYYYYPYISESAIYCNDRNYTNNSNELLYSAFSRISQEKRNPTYKCENPDDRFNADKTMGGNGKLIFPIGLMTFDEAIYAGAPSPQSWLWSVTSSCWWTMTPSYTNSSYSGLYCITGEIYPTRIWNERATNSNDIRPVISIKPCVKVSGIGTKDDPYTVDYTKSFKSCNNVTIHS